MHRAVRELVPSANVTPETLARLAALSESALASCAHDLAEPWWRRFACARALLGRVTDESAEALLRCATRDGEVTEIRRALLDALAAPQLRTAAALLAWLRDQVQPSPLDAAVLRARAALGDVSAAPLLAALAADPWRHERATGEQGIDTLIDMRGERDVLEALGAGSLEALAFDAAAAPHRLLGVRLLHRARGDVTRALDDASTIVAHEAHQLLSGGTDSDDKALIAMLGARRPSAFWALVVLARRGREVEDVRARWQALDSPCVAVPIPADVRAAIVAEYAPGERETDPRWLLERLCTTQPLDIDDREREARQRAIVARAVAALDAASLAPGAPVSAGEQYQQGEGTFFHVPTKDGGVTISTLGSFFAMEEEREAIATALRCAGFRHITAELSRVVVAGLHVYCFGRRDPLSVGQLLFYWQD